MRKNPMVTVCGKAHRNVDAFLKELWMVARDLQAHGEPLVVRVLEEPSGLTPHERRQLR